MMNTLTLVRQRLSRHKKAQPFWIGDFYDLGSSRQVQSAFAVCVRAGELKRLARGIYACPLSFSTRPYCGSAEDLACLWAKQFGFVLVPQGMEAAYRLGLQTQMPMRKIFWTNGHSRTFQIGNEVVDVRKRQDRCGLLLASTPAGELYRGLSVFSQQQVTLQQLQIAFERLQLTAKQKQQMRAILLNSELHSHVKLLLNLL
jgi:hypothetical protein